MLVFNYWIVWTMLTRLAQHQSQAAWAVHGRCPWSSRPIWGSMTFGPTWPPMGRPSLLWSVEANGHRPWPFWSRWNGINVIPTPSALAHHWWRCREDFDGNTRWIWCTTMDLRTKLQRTCKVGTSDKLMFNKGRGRMKQKANHKAHQKAHQKAQLD